MGGFRRFQRKNRAGTRFPKRDGERIKLSPKGRILAERASFYYVGLLFDGRVDEARQMIEAVRHTRDYIGYAGITFVHEALAAFAGMQWRELSDEEQIYFAVDHPEILEEFKRQADSGQVPSPNAEIQKRLDEAYSPEITKLGNEYAEILRRFNEERY